MTSPMLLGGGVATSHAYDVRRFGAVVNGVTDDTAAFNAAFAAAASAGEAVVFPSGTALINGEVTVLDGVRKVEGNGRESSVLKLGAAGARLKISSQRAHVSNFSIDGNAVATNGIVASNWARGHGLEVLVRNCVGSAWLVESPSGGGLNNNHLTLTKCSGRFSNRGFEIADAAGAQADSTTVGFIECVGRNNTAEGILLRNSQWRVWGGMYTANGTGVRLGVSGDNLSTQYGSVYMPRLEDSAVYVNEGVGTNSLLVLHPAYGVDATIGVSYIKNATGKNVVQGVGSTGFKIETQTGFEFLVPHTAGAAFTATNVTTDRSFDADATTLAEVADVLGTLIADLKATGSIP